MKPIFINIRPEFLTTGRKHLTGISLRIGIITDRWLGSPSW